MQEVIMLHYTYIQFSVLMYQGCGMEENPITQPLAHCNEKRRSVAKPCHAGSHSPLLHIHTKNSSAVARGRGNPGLIPARDGQLLLFFVDLVLQN
jgi:hypothetical protein